MKVTMAMCKFSSNSGLYAKIFYRSMPQLRIEQFLAEFTFKSNQSNKSNPDSCCENETVCLCCSVILKGKPSGSHFPEGNHKLSYTVFDRAENKATCRFNVRVRGEFF